MTVTVPHFERAVHFATAEAPIAGDFSCSFEDTRKRTLYNNHPPLQQALDEVREKFIKEERLSYQIVFPRFILWHFITRSVHRPHFVGSSTTRRRRSNPHGPLNRRQASRLAQATPDGFNRGSYSSTNHTTASASSMTMLQLTGQRRLGKL